MGVPVHKEPQDRALELFDLVVHLMAQEAFVQDAEEQLDLVDPGSVDGCVVEMEAIAVSLVEACPALILAVVVDVEIVPDDMYRAFWIALRDFFHERYQVLACASTANLPEDFAGLGLEAREQIAGTITDVFDVHTLVLSGPGRLYRMFASQRLHAGLFIDTQDRRSFGRVQIELADPGDFDAKRRVRTMQPHSYPMRTNLCVGEDANDRATAKRSKSVQDLLLGDDFLQQIERPGLAELHPEIRRCTARHSDHLASTDRIDFNRAPWAWPVIQSVQTLSQVSIPPLRHGLAIDIQTSSHATHTSIFMEHQDELDAQSLGSLVLGAQPPQLLPTGPRQPYPLLRRTAGGRSLAALAGR